MQAPTSQTEREELFQHLVRVNRELEQAGRPDNFYTSLEASWRRFGSLTERQEAALVRSFTQREERAAARAQEATEIRYPMPTGRVTITGEILSTKWQENRFGGALKMLVKSEAGWKVWGTVPASVSGNDALKGRRVTFTATLEPKEPSFGFFSRPANARLLPEAQPEALEPDDNHAPVAPAAPVAAPAPVVRRTLTDIIAKAKELEERKQYDNGSGVYSHPGNAWDTDSMVA